MVCVVVGQPTVQRGLDVEYFGKDYRAHLLARTPPADKDRLWFFDQLKPALLADLLAVSDLHVHPARAYPVARSLLEAMAAGCTVLASDIDPIREVVTHGQTGLLAAPADLDAWEARALEVLADPPRFRPLGAAASELVNRKYSRNATLPHLAERLAQLANGGAV